MQPKLIELMTLAMEISQVSDGKVSFRYLPVYHKIEVHFYNTEERFHVNLNDPDADDYLESIADRLLDFHIEMGGEVEA